MPLMALLAMGVAASQESPDEPRFDAAAEVASARQDRQNVQSMADLLLKANFSAWRQKREAILIYESLNRILEEYEINMQHVSPAKLKKVTEILGTMRARRDSLATEDTPAIPSSHVDQFISEVPKKQPTLLFMADTRPIVATKPDSGVLGWLPHGKNGQRLPYWSMATVHNFLYSRRHGYDFAYFHV